MLSILTSNYLSKAFALLVANPVPEMVTMFPPLGLTSPLTAVIDVTVAAMLTAEALTVAKPRPA